jgi:hypothetical protein
MAPRVAPALLNQQVVIPTTHGGGLMQLGEHVPDLMWPQSTRIYDKMRRDAHVAAVIRAFQLPITGTQWHVVDSPEVDPSITQFVRNSLGLIEEGDGRRRRRGQGISWDKALRESMLSVVFGHSYLEPVFSMGPPGPSDTLPPGTYAHLSKLVMVDQQTIGGFNIDPLGGLVSVVQETTGPDGRWVENVIPANLLIAFVNDQEGANWAGQSLLRPAYKHWFLKDKLERLNWQIAERNGMGIPIGYYDDEGDRVGVERAMSAMRAGEYAGGAFPTKTNVQLLGVSGSTTDTMPSIMYHAQEISRALLAMFLDMGHDTGARSLGETFVDFFTMAINSVITTLEETFTEELSRRIVQLNFGDGAAYPEIVADDITAASPLTADVIGQLVTAGVLVPDPALDAFVRHKFGMPPVSPDAVDAPPPDVPDDTIDIPASGGSSGGSKMSGVIESNRLSRIRQRMARRR